MITSVKPPWLVVKSASQNELNSTRALLDYYKLKTVCQEAWCPNIYHCWKKGAVTLMILGDTCTRSCAFCATSAGDPKGKIDNSEPDIIAEYIAAASLDYIVITSVTRDDLPDGGAGVFASVIERVRAKMKQVRIEVLIPDFGGSLAALEQVVMAQPDVIGHNIETVERLTPDVRDTRASYKTTLRILKAIKDMFPKVITKSGLMLGMGESEMDITGTLRDLRQCDVDILTIGQYLSPSPEHLPIVKYITPEDFMKYEALAYEIGFRSVVAGPLVRSSYESARAMKKAINS